MKRRRYATWDELSELIREFDPEIIESQVDKVLDALVYLDVHPDALVKITVDEEAPG